MIVVFDIDGVLADATHRQHHLTGRPKDWDAFFAEVSGDPLLPSGRSLLGQLREGHEVVLLSGRPERTRLDTEAWLARHGIEFSRLVLRADDDHRPAARLKGELIRQVGSPGEILVVVDDDPSVVDLLLRAGYRTRLQT